MDRGWPGYVMWPSDEPCVLHTYDEQTVSEGGVTAHRQACFDADTGYRERTRVMSGATPQDTDVIAVFTPDGDGNTVTEEYYGADVQTASTSADLCALTPPATSQYRLTHSYASGALATSRHSNSDGTSLGFTPVNLRAGSFPSSAGCRATQGHNGTNART